MKIEISRELAEIIVAHMGKQYQPQEVCRLLRSLNDALAEDEPEEVTVVEPLTLQQRLYNWQLCNFGEPNIEHLKLGVCEEVGELCHAVLKREQGIRGFNDEAYYIEQASDAIADATIYLMQLCSSLGVDVDLDAYPVDDYGDRTKMVSATLGCYEAAAYLANSFDHEIWTNGILEALSLAAAVLGVDFESTVNRVAEQVMKRDWTK